MKNVPARFLTSLVFGLLSFLPTPAFSAAFEKNDIVALTRDESLYFSKVPSRTGIRGEVFRVLQFVEKSNLVFVADRDSTGRIIALNGQAASFVLVRRNVAPALNKALDTLINGKLADAIAQLDSIVQVVPTDTAISSLKAQLVRIVEAANRLSQSEFGQEEAARQSAVKRRNADISARPNLLNPHDRSGQARSQADQAAARAIDQGAADAVKGAKTALKQTLQSLADFGAVSYKTGDTEIAMAVLQALDGPFATLGGTELSGGALHREREKIRETFDGAKRAQAEVESHLTSSKLLSALARISEVLKTAPAIRGAIALKAEIEGRIAFLEQRLGVAAGLFSTGRYDAAQEIVTQLSRLCSDHPGLAETSRRLTAFLERRTTELARAKSLIAAGNARSALSILNEYGSEADIKDALPKAAREEEQAGNLLAAYERYEAAGLVADANRVRGRSVQQREEYFQARVMIAERKFDDAIRTYEKYGDEASKRDTLKAKGRRLLEEGKSEEALAAFKAAGSEADVKAAVTLMDERRNALVEGRNLEKAEKLDEALRAFARANAREDLVRVARTLAKTALEKKDFAAAAEYFETAGDFEDAGKVRKENGLTEGRPGKRLEPHEVYAVCSLGAVTVFSQADRGSGHGSGFFVGRGFILTNQHVVDGASVLTVMTSDGKKYKATVVDQSKVPDVALLRIEIGDHRILELADSDRIVTGQKVFAIGTPTDPKLAGAFADGLISKTDVVFRENKVFQTNTLINHGSSGGPLLDDRGNVVGINTFGLGTAARLQDGSSVGSDIQGINFAIKINEARPLLQKHLPTLRR